MKSYPFLPDVQNRQEKENELIQTFPFLKRKQVGNSLLNRPIYAYTLGNPQTQTLFAGAFHGMEWLTSLILLQFLEHCSLSVQKHQCMNGCDLYRILLQKGVTVIPCINPDGVEIQLHGSETAKPFKSLIDRITKDTSKWQANARGVDLNHNFDAGWQELKALERKNHFTKPNTTRYGGENPESEPEVRMLVNFCKENQFCRAFAFHSQGREIYWNFGPNTPKESFELANQLGAVSGYQVSKPEGLAVGGGFKDWFIQYFKRPGFTIEIGLGENPLPLTDFSEEYPRLFPLLCRGIQI